jgi:hypothetical protein
MSNRDPYSDSIRVHLFRFHFLVSLCPECSVIVPVLASIQERESFRPCRSFQRGCYCAAAFCHFLVHCCQLLRFGGRPAEPARNFLAVAFTDCLRMLYGHRSWVLSAHLRHFVVIFRFGFQSQRLCFVVVRQLKVVFLRLGTRDQRLDFLLAEG